MTGPILGSTSALSNTSTRWIAISNNAGMALAASELSVAQPMPSAGTVQNFYMWLSSAPGVGTKYTVNVLKNGSPTAITFDIADNATTGSDNTNVVSYNAGDRITVQFVPTNTPAAPTSSWSIDNTSDGYPILSGASGTLTGGAPNYASLMASSWRPTNTDSDNLIPTAGVITNLYLIGNTNAGGVATVTVTLVKNGVDTALIASFTGSNRLANNTSDAVTVDPGDLVYLRCDLAGTPATGRLFTGVTFTPTTLGESVQMYSTETTLSTSSTQYLGVGGGNNALSTNENTKKNYLGSSAILLKKLYFRLGAQPGVGKSYTATVRSGGADTAVAAIISDANTTNNDTSDSVTAVSPDFLSISYVPTGTPTASVPKASFVTYQGAPVSDTITTTDSPGYYSDLIVNREAYTLSLVSFVNKSDTITASENVQLLVSNNINVSDTITATESVKVATVDTSSISDTITTTESVTLQLVSFVNVNDTITTTENSQVLIVQTVSANVSDTITTTESIKLEVNSSISVFDTITATESLKLNPNSFISKIENITVTESTGRLVTSFINKSETITATESVAVPVIQYAKAVSDTLTATEAVQVSITETVSKSETITSSESVSVVITVTVNKSDQITTTETIVLGSILVQLSVSDTITVTESVNDQEPPPPPYRLLNHPRRHLGRRQLGVVVRRSIGPRPIRGPRS